MGAAITPIAGGAQAGRPTTSTSRTISTSCANAVLNQTTSVYQSISLTDLPINCRNCLLNILFYESGLTYSEASTKAIAQKICFNDAEASQHLLTQVRKRTMKENT